MKRRYLYVGYSKGGLIANGIPGTAEMMDQLVRQVWIQYRGVARAVKLLRESVRPSLRCVVPSWKTNIAKLEDGALATKPIIRTVLRSWICRREVDASRECEIQIRKAV